MLEHDHSGLYPAQREDRSGRYYDDQDEALEAVGLSEQDAHADS